MLELADGSALRGDRLLVATGRRPAHRRPRPGDRRASSRARTGSRSTRACSLGDGLWAIGDVTGVWPLTYVGKYQGRDRRRQHPRPRARGRLRARSRASCSPTRRRPRSATPTARSPPPPSLAEVPRTATYTRAYDTQPGFLTLVSDGERLTGAYALGPEAGEWLQQATVAIRARVPLAVMRDVIQPFPTFSEVFLHALAELGAKAPVPA